MALVAGILLFLLGFAMLTAGVALLLGGDITFKSGRRLAKPVSRKIGILFVSFFPLVFITNAGLRLIDPDEAVPTALLNWPIACVCLGLGLVWLRRGMLPPAEVTPAPVDVSAGASLPAFDGPAATPRPPIPPKNAPFDFS